MSKAIATLVIPERTPATIKKVEQWCAGDYLQALAQGNTLPAESVTAPLPKEYLP